MRYILILLLVSMTSTVSASEGEVVGGLHNSPEIVKMCADSKKKYTKRIVKYNRRIKNTNRLIDKIKRKHNISQLQYWNEYCNSPN